MPNSTSHGDINLQKRRVLSKSLFKVLIKAVARLAAELAIEQIALDSWAFN